MIFSRKEISSSVHSFNDAVWNEVLAPIGKALPKGVKGREAVGYALDTVGKAYDDLLPKMSAQIDDAFMTEMGSLSRMASEMPDTRFRQLTQIVKNTVTDRITPAGKMSGETLKKIESELGKKASKYATSPDVDQQQLGDALMEIQAAFRRMIGRQNPEYASELANANKAYSMVVRAAQAAGYKGAHEGVFSAGHLQGAIRGLDKSFNKRGFAKGDAILQDLSDPAQSVLGTAVPDSGTPFRLANMAGAGFALADPMTTAGVAAGGYAATREPIRKLAEILMTRRPEVAKPIGKGIEELIPYLELAGIGAAQR